MKKKIEKIYTKMPKSQNINNKQITSTKYKNTTIKIKMHKNMKKSKFH